MELTNVIVVARWLEPRTQEQKIPVGSGPPFVRTRYHLEFVEHLRG